MPEEQQEAHAANIDLLAALKADALHGVTAADPAFRALAWKFQALALCFGARA